MNREAVVRDDVLASARVVDAGCEAIGGGDIIAGTCVVDMGCEAVGGGDILAGTCVVDVGHGAVDGDVAHDTVVTSSPSTACPTSPVTCSLILTSFMSPFESPGSLVLASQVEVELNEQ